MTETARCHWIFILLFSWFCSQHQCIQPKKLHFPGTFWTITSKCKSLVHFLRSCHLEQVDHFQGAQVRITESWVPSKHRSTLLINLWIFLLEKQTITYLINHYYFAFLDHIELKLILTKYCVIAIRKTKAESFLKTQ